MEITGYVAVALALVLLGYLVPHLARSRQLLLDSRVEDRFSGDLRILATAGSGQWPRGHAGGPGPSLHATSARRPEAPMTPPRARGALAPGSVSDDARALAAAHAARAARRARRSAAVRRRLVLTTALLLTSAGAWAGVGLTGLAWGIALIPTLLLVTVLVLGRRAAVQARINDRRDRAEMARLEQRLRGLARPEGGSRAPAAPRPARAAQVPAHWEPRSADADPALARVSREVPAETSTPTGTAEPAPTGTPVDAPVPSASTARVVGEPIVGMTIFSGSAQPAAARPEERSVAGRAPERAQADPTPTDTDVEEAAVEGASAPSVGESAQSGSTQQELAQREPAKVSSGEPAPTDSGAEPDATDEPRPWTPVPVPAPSYTLKPRAPRRDVAPYAASAPEPAAQVPHRPAAASVSRSRAEEESAEPALDLDAVLARRRAAGA